MLKVPGSTSRNQNTQTQSLGKPSVEASLVQTSSPKLNLNPMEKKDWPQPAVFEAKSSTSATKTVFQTGE